MLPYGRGKIQYFHEVKNKSENKINLIMDRLTNIFLEMLAETQHSCFCPCMMKHHKLLSINLNVKTHVRHLNYFPCVVHNEVKVFIDYVQSFHG